MLYEKNRSRELADELFRNPSSEYRAAPFWAWNCELSGEILDEQIRIFKEMGFGGFHMHPRVGLSTPYLKEEFLGLIRRCTDRAKEEGMLSYLYDEDRWPSGAAGGYVTKDHRYRQRSLVFSVTPREHFPLDEAVSEGKLYLLAVFDIVLNENGELSSCRQIGEEEPAAGKKWYAYVLTAQDDPWYNNQAYVDTLSKESVNKFIQITYEAYEKTVGEDFGQTVPSIFTDEPQFVHKQPLHFADSTDDARLPWTFSLPESFREKTGYDLVPRLPELIWNLPEGKISTARYHFHDHVCDLFTRSFADNCGGWCENHGLRLTGHMMEEPTLLSQTGALGEAMRSYRSFGIPGIDMLCNWVELSTAKQCQSAVHQYGREAMLSELYGVTNWDFDFRGHKFQGDWQAALGVTLRVPHLSWVSMAGEAKRDYPASISYQSPWYREYKYIEDHFARLNTALTRGKPVVDLAVIHPIESYWLHFGPGENTAGIRSQLDKKFQDMIRWLLFGTVDFDFISESLLPDQCRGTDGALQVGEMAYKAVLVPDCLTLRGSTLEILKKFRQAGGTVIFAGSCPKYIDAVESGAARELYGQSTAVPYDRVSVLEAVSAFRTVKIQDRDGALTENLIYNLRQDNTCKWLFIAHADSEEYKKRDYRERTDAQRIRLTIAGKYTPKLYNTLDGSISQIPFEIKNGGTVLEYDLFASDSLLLRLDEETVPTLSEKAACRREPLQTLRFLQKVPYRREEPNVLLLDRAEYSLNGEAFRPEEEILKLDNLCRDRLGFPRKGNAFAQPWVVPEEKAADSLTLRMTVRSEAELSGVKLAIEDAEKLKIQWNGEPVPSQPDGWFVDHAIKTVPLPAVKAGDNTLVVTLPFGRRTNTEWCYLIGEFNVKVEGALSTLLPPSEQIGFSSLTGQGLPFYGGNFRYRLEMETPDCKARIRANYYRGALLKVLVDGKDMGRIVFSPYELELGRLSAGKHTVELILFGTRINTFGGMHNVYQEEWTGPDFWRTTGGHWCYEYVLKDTGILSSPVIELFAE